MGGSVVAVNRRPVHRRQGRHGGRLSTRIVVFDANQSGLAAIHRSAAAPDRRIDKRRPTWDIASN
jgi:hypothetical protein